MIDLLQAATTGHGVYSLPEAARYAKMHQKTLRSWFCGGTDRAALRPGEINSLEFKAITFLEFVEALAIRSLRRDYSVSLQKIRAAINTAQDRYGVNHPFAHKAHRTPLGGNRSAWCGQLVGRDAVQMQQP